MFSIPSRLLSEEPVRIKAERPAKIFHVTSDTDKVAQSGGRDVSTPATNKMKANISQEWKLLELFAQQKPLCSIMFSICQKKRRLDKDLFQSTKKKFEWIKTAYGGYRVQKTPRTAGKRIQRRASFTCAAAQEEEIDARRYHPRGGSSLWNPQVERRRQWLICKRLQGYRPQRKSFYFGHIVLRKMPLFWNYSKRSSSVCHETWGNLKSCRHLKRRGSCLTDEDQSFCSEFPLWND